MSLPRLTKQYILEHGPPEIDDISIPDEDAFELPEKVLQFGSGRLLRGFVDYFIDKANRNGIFGGRVVIVQSTGSGRSEILNDQDGLFTLCIQGLEHGEPVQRYDVLSSVSRAIPARQDWDAVLEVARSPALNVIVSNTTEVGIRLEEDDRIDRDPPSSYPGKLTAVLYERFQEFSGAPDKGCVIVPTELIESNGDELERIVVELAQIWDLGEEFIEWIEEANEFCNSLVDRIVTGRPEDEELEQRWKELGYRDEILTIAEVYRLWAIEGTADTRAQLSFAETDEGVIVTDDISPFRERKVRILNGAHTISVPTAFLAGETTVLDMMQNTDTSTFVEGVMMDEIVPTLDVDRASAVNFAREVLDRFRNPYLEHELIDITFQESTKMRYRVVPSILGHYEMHDTAPERICFGFASFLLFMRGREEEGDTIYGRRDGASYPINDDQAAYFMDQWKDVQTGSQGDVRILVDRICSNEKLWGTDLTKLPEFSEKVVTYLHRSLNEGVAASLAEFVTERTE
jgi:tagaturonate reductase